MEPMRRIVPLVLVCACSGAGGGGESAPDEVGGAADSGPAEPELADAGVPEGEETGGEDYPTPVPVQRFDVAGFICPPSGVCDPALDNCFCRAEFDGLNYTSQSHLLGMGAETQRPLIRGAGNYQAYYVNDLNHAADGTGWRYVTATARADEMVARCRESFPTVCPQWFLINEISPSVWPVDGNYRRWVTAVARRLRETHNKLPIVFAPFAAAGQNDGDWQALSSVAHIGVENFLSGAEIKAHGFSQSWCAGQYQQSLSAYQARGVPKSRIILIEHFANNVAGKGWGRAGVSLADWKTAIRARSAASRSLHFAGFLSYCWACNGLHESNQNRRELEDIYAAIAMP